ncbi:MAG: NADH-quinone oxidoreductase subunit NuoF [Peptococcaceae bacterium]|jgi:NADH-quinone oxidoreductase subunit F|nr:NADH-quinone oxidoreductase subunit NuoF [Peptococcaceae bacterium]
MEIRVGMGSCGMAAGAKKTWDTLSELCQGKANISLLQVGCNGMCFAEPLVEVIDGDGKSYLYGRVDEKAAAEIFAQHITDGIVLEKYLVSEEELAFLTKQTRIALRNCGIIDPENIEHYVARGGYAGLKKALSFADKSEIIEMVKTAGLRGRGGAGFPTWFKWQAAKNSRGDEKYIVCNADEGDPGAFMDRSLLEGDPHTVIEGMIIAGVAIGAREGIFYVRAEYPVAIKRLEIAIRQAEEAGFLGEHILGTDFSFSLRIKAGAGAFVCGEETALLASLEGERGMPRLKPPFPAERGYWQKPSNINNVETYANVPWILANGGEAYAAMGTEKSKGTKVFALAGKIKRGGLVEVPMGITLRQVVFDIGGGIQGDKAIKGVQMGGPSGGCIPESLLDTPIDYDSIMKTGAIMGSGGMIVMDETTCMVNMAQFFMDFTQKESCGKCTHCRIGTTRMLEILERIVTGDGKEGDIELLEELASAIKDGALCGLGNSAPNPVLSTIRYFREEYEAHIQAKTCPAKQCKDLLTYEIKQDKCTGCTLCALKCPVNAISGEKKQPHMINQDVCTKCGNCYTVCRFGAVEVK